MVRDWSNDAIHALRLFAAELREEPYAICPICKHWGGHAQGCTLLRLLKHVDHVEKPEDGPNREAALRVVARLIHWWGFTKRELEQAAVVARGDFERAMDGRAEETRTDHHHIADEAAGAAATGVDELVSSIADKDMEGAAAHAESTVELARRAVEAAAAEAHMEPADVQHLRCTIDRAAQAMEHAEAAAQRFVAFAVGREEELREMLLGGVIDKGLEKIMRFFGVDSQEAPRGAQ